jgi:hypothetical protein
VLTMASVKARSTGPKSGAPSTWHPPQHGVGAAKLRLAGLHHEVGSNSTTEWWTRWVTFPVSSTKRRQGWTATSPTAWHGCSSPAVLGGIPQRRRQKGARRLGWWRWSPPLLSLPLLLLLFSGSWWWRRIRMGIRETGWGLVFVGWPA